ncbi:MAG: MBL fold metallo-hydrolase [Desulfatitalea sp.]|nr:MBL fold metallo-hydrolase [Desulfatitalea sp.]
MVQEIRPDLFLIEVPLPNSPLKSLNAYVVRSDQRNLVIDTGLNRTECYDALTAGLKALDVDLNRTDFFITHLHADHFGLVSRLKTDTSRVFFNRPDAEIIEMRGGWEPMFQAAARNGFPERLLRSALEQHPGYKFGSEWVPELKLLNDGDRVEVGDYHFQCVQTPGHTVGHTCLYEPDKKLFVAGDHILIDITPNIQCWSDTEDPLARYMESLDRVYALDIELVLPGHRRLIDDSRARITALKEHHEKRCAEIMAILDGAEMNAYAVAARMSWDIRCDSWEDFPVAQKWFATGEAIAHLRYLEGQGNIQHLKQDGFSTFKSSSN